MKVVLLQDVAKIGKKYDIKNVSDGYALNFLIPNKKAKIATADVIKEVESEKKNRNEKKKKMDERIINDIKKLNNTIIHITAKMTKEGHLFAGIGKNEIIEAIKDQKAIDIQPEHLILDKPIKRADGQKIEIKANGEKAEFTVEIVPASD